MLIVLNGLDISFDDLVTTDIARVEEISHDATFLGLLRAFESCLLRSMDHQILALANLAHKNQS